MGSKEQLELRLKEYKALCTTYPRNGLGVEPHCTDVGLEDPQSKKENPMKAEEERFVCTPVDQAVVALGKACGFCRTDKKAYVNVQDAKRIMDGLSTTALKYSTHPSADLQRTTMETAKTNPMWKALEEQGSTQRLMEAEMIS